MRKIQAITSGQSERENFIGGDSFHGSMVAVGYPPVWWMNCNTKNFHCLSQAGVHDLFTVGDRITNSTSHHGHHDSNGDFVCESVILSDPHQTLRSN